MQCVSMDYRCQYIYDKRFKDECPDCEEYDQTGSIYCLCNNYGNSLKKHYVCDKSFLKDVRSYDRLVMHAYVLRQARCNT